MLYNLPIEEKRSFESLPIAMSIAQVEDNFLKYLFVSPGYCELFNQTTEEALNILNSNLYEFICEEDKVRAVHFYKSIKDKKKSSYDITYRVKGRDKKNYFLLNVIAKQKKKNEHTLFYFSYSRISASLKDSISLDKKIQSQQISIAEDSLNAIAIIAKKDFKILYLNKAAKLLFPHDDVRLKDLPCYTFFRNKDKPCDYCPLKITTNIGELFELDCEFFNKKIQVHIVETIWNGEDAYIEYIRDITADKRNERLFNLYKSLIAHKQALDIEVGALYGFDLETERVVFYFVHAETADHEGKHFNEVINSFYPSIVGDIDKKKYLDFFNIKTIKDNASKMKTSSIEYHQKINKKIFVLRAAYSFIEDPISKHTLVVINVYDVTERLEMEKMLKAIVTEQNEFIMRQDESSKTCVVLASENNFLNFPVGYSRYTYKEYDNYISHLKTLIETYGQQRILSCEKANNIITEGNYSVTYVIKKDNQVYHKRALSFRAKDKSLYTVVYDVTDLALEEKKRSSKLEKVNKKLLIAQREATLANRAKTEFLSRMSHDMRTPLGAILSLADFGTDENNPTNYKDYFNQIKENGEYLLSLVNDLLDFQKIEANSIDLDERIIEFGATAKSIKRIVKLRANEKNIKLHFTAKKDASEKYLIFDDKRFKQILVNILNNAIKYTPVGGTVKWSLLVTRNSKGELIAKHTVNDTGVGMSKEFQKHMFEPFSKENNDLSESEGGTGLGLVITKNLVEAMGGSISCDSELGKGTTFYIKLPLKTPKKEQLIEYFNYKNLTCSDLKFDKKKILVCEDVQINQFIIKKLLENKNMLVTLANNGVEGVRLSKDNNFDAILMDIRMPVLNGIDAAKKIRAFNKKVPIIALSANAFAQDIRRSLESGMNAHLAKPIVKEQLYKTLAELLN